MRCEDVERLLDDRGEGRLSDEAESALTAHLAACPTCGDLPARREAEAEAVRAAVDGLPVRADFTSSVLVRVRDEEHRARRRGVALLGAGVLTAAAAALLVLAVMRAPPRLRVDGTEGGVLALDSRTASWRAMGEGDVLDAGAWVLTFPDRRASVRVDDLRVLICGDSLVGLASSRVELLRGGLLLTAGGEPCAAVTPYGTVEATDATVVVTLCYGREPVIRVVPGGIPRRTGSLLLAVAGAASPSVPGQPDVPPPPGHVLVTAVAGEAVWRSGSLRGRLKTGERIRLGPAEPATAFLAPDAGREEWMDRAFARVEDEGPSFPSGADALAVLTEELSAPTASRRIAASLRLGRLCGRPEASLAVVSRFREEPESRVRVVLVEALRRLDARDQSAVVRDALGDPDTLVRSAALRTWLALRGRDGLAEIGDRINDPVGAIRRQALEALAEIGDPAGRPWAERALEDPDPVVAEQARRTLDALR